MLRAFKRRKSLTHAGDMKGNLILKGQVPAVNSKEHMKGRLM